MKKVATLIMTFFLVSGIQAQAATITFNGELPQGTEGKYLTILGVKKGGNYIEPADTDITWIDQVSIAPDLSYSFSIPESVFTANNHFATNYNIDLGQTNDIYVSPTGSSSGTGTKTSPVNSLALALDKAEDNDTIVLMDTIKLSNNFSLSSNKKVVITGKSYETGNVEGGLDFTGTVSARFDFGVEFKDLKFTTMAETSDGKVNRIFACGNNMIMGEGLEMSNPIDIFGGNTVNHSAENTYLKICSGTYRRIYGGGYDSPTTNDTTVIIDGNINIGKSAEDSDDNYMDSRIYGGGYNPKSVVNGNTNITFNSGTIAYIFGGGASAMVDGDTNITLNGGRVMNVYGGMYKTDTYEGNTNITMKDGVVESIFGGSFGNDSKGNITISVTGGEILRRIYGGCYNEWSGSWGSSNHVYGTIMVKVGPNAQLATGNELSSGNKDDMGLFGGSRIANNLSDETAIFAFIDDSYETHKAKIGQQTDWIKNTIKSHHDYILKVGTGGDVNINEGNRISITPNSGKRAVVNSVNLDSTTYTLNKSETIITFVESKDKGGISILPNGMTGSSEGVSVNTDIETDDTTLYGENSKLIVAAYGDDETLIKVVIQSITANGNYDIDLKGVDISKIAYVRLFVWEIDSINPIGAFKTILP